ncbi:3-keto-5-aminohexanoate cleavage protein, partial [Raoultella ornithinolytica]|uniref:3-keto-5-aminohexanoate cleavage protein n=1 Tax=Raoultella ornithinolytica TaxID=54291 RepID=UPI0013C3063E
NYLKLKADGEWAWPPMLFDNPVSKIEAMLQSMQELRVLPECECFDTGIVRSVAMFAQRGMLSPRPSVSLVMGVASGMPCKPAWLPLLLEELPDAAIWQVIAIGREEVWQLQRRAAELGGHLRSGLEDTFYLPDGTRAESNGDLIAALAKVATVAGRSIAGPEEARK